MIIPKTVAIGYHINPSVPQENYHILPKDILHILTLPLNNLKVAYNYPAGKRNLDGMRLCTRPLTVYCKSALRQIKLPIRNVYDSPPANDGWTPRSN